MNLTSTSVLELLELYADVADELRRRKICRTANNPAGDYAESLVSAALGLTLTANSHRGYDALDRIGKRFEIKGRRLSTKNERPQLSVIRDMPAAPFDYLVGVVFDRRYRISYAAQVPHAVAIRYASFSTRQKGHVVDFRRAILSESGVIDRTEELRTIQATADSYNYQEMTSAASTSGRGAR